MKGGVVNDNLAKGSGGGVWSSGSVYVYGSAVIGDEAHKNEIATSDSGGYGNICKGWWSDVSSETSNGGGIYCSVEYNDPGKKLYLGYDENGEKTEWAGGIYHNYGAGVYVKNYEFKMDSGTISGNFYSGIYYYGQNDVRSEITGGLVTKNKHNNTKNNGAGLNFDVGVLNVTGGKIKGNFLTESGEGTDVYASAVYTTYEGFSIGGSACFGKIYLQKFTDSGKSAYLRITAPLEPPVDEGGITATLKIYEDLEYPSGGYRRGDITLKGFGGYAVTSQDAQKILATDGWELFEDDDDSSQYNITKPIYVSGAGHSSATGNGSDEDGVGDGSKAHPFASISKATRLMTAQQTYTVYIDGTLQAQAIPEDVDYDYGTTYKPYSIRLVGLNGLKSNGEPKDAIDAGNHGTALTVNGNLSPLIIKNLKITGGNSDLPNWGGGIYIGRKEYQAYPGNYYSSDLQLMDGALITGNTATGANSAGGIYANGNFNFYGGEISSNTGSHAVYVRYDFSVKGSAYVPDNGDGCDVYLNYSTPKIKPMAPLTKHNSTDKKMRVTISPDKYTAGYKLMEKNLWTDPVSIPSECGKFTVGNGSSYGDFVINGLGELASSYIGSKVPGSVLEVGDVVFTDGSASPYTSVTSAQQASAVAVIFYRGTACSNDGKTRALGVGLVQASGKSWCSGSAKGYGVSIDSTTCAPDQEAAGSATTFEDAVDRNGKDNYDQLDSALRSLPGGTDTYDGATKYTANYFASVYRNAATNITSSAYSNDWYLPTAAELFQIYKNKATVNAALSACGGTTFSGAYLTSSQHASDASMIMYLDFSETSQIFYGVDKTLTTKKTCAIHEF